MLRTEQAAIEAVIHPSFSRFFEAPYSEHIPFQDGPNISFNGEVSTFLAVPVKRNDRLLPSQVASGPHPAAPGAFISLLKSKSTNRTTGSGGSIGGLKASAMQYLNFKRALLPSMLALLSRMQIDKDLMQRNKPSTDQGDSTTLGRSRPARMDVQTDPAAQAKLLLSEVETYLAEEQTDNTGDAEERLRRQFFYTTGLLLPTEAQWYLLTELRIHAGAPERSEGGIERLSHYYAQLLYLEPKFPFETDEIQMNFTWYESLVPDRKVVTNCIQYEKASVLFNIAAVYSILASAQSLWTPDGKRKAAAYFQKGAGVLVYIRDRLCARFKPKLDRASDLNESTLTAAAELMLAQAMECFYEKANDTKASSGVTAKIAAQTADFYEVARRAAEAPTELCKARFPKYWSDHIKSKTFMFTAIAHMHTAPQSAADSAVGERIARVSVAKEAVDKAAKYSRDVGGALHELVQGHAIIINTAHSFLIHANFERHHHPSFDSRLLPPLKRPSESLVMAAPLEDAITDPRTFNDIFGAIMSAIDHGSSPRKPGNDDTRFDGGGSGNHPVPPPRRRGPLANPVLKHPSVSANEPITTSKSVPHPTQKRPTSPALLRSHLPSMGLANSSDIPPYNPAVVPISSSAESVELRNFLVSSGVEPPVPGESKQFEIGLGGNTYSPPLTNISLSDYDQDLSIEEMEDMLPTALQDSDLSSHMDEIYAQIRALVLSQDALRTQNANELREALATVLKSHSTRIGGVVDAMARWTQRKMDDARNRLTEALQRCEREEQRKQDIEREVEKERNRAREMEKEQQRLRKVEMERRERDHDRDRGKVRESRLRDFIERTKREAEQRKTVDIKAKPTAERKEAEEVESRDADVRRNTSKRKGKMPASLGHNDRTTVLHEQPTSIVTGPVQNDNSRIEHWVEEQRRMSIGSGTQPAIVQNIRSTRQQHHMQRIGSDASRLTHTGTQTPLLNMKVETRSRTHYKRIASAAAAAAAAGVSAAFHHDDHNSTEAEHTEPGHSLPRRDPPATVSFDVHGSFNPPVQQTDHKIRRKPSGGYPVPYHAGEGFEPEHGDDYQKEHGRGGNPDVEVIAAAAAEPARRESTALHHRMVSHGGGRGAGAYKEHNDVLVREFLSGDGMREGSVSQTVEKFEQERRRSGHMPT
ncbi:hypothetical protein SpCBS45565_g05380 [Spizellomyces sp. 'palustris']|nr:hypothetical protein SpCBS45565_g05380 [Spizellomyces sp. 'palustris']